MDVQVNPVQMNRAMQLTPRQEEILAFIGAYQREHRIPPSSRVIQKQFNFGSQTTVIRYLKALADKKAIDQLADGSWGVKTNEVQSLFELPIYGEIPAGVPAMREQEPAYHIAIDPSLFGVSRARQKSLWGLVIRGDSMTGAQIRDGDIGVFERREPGIGEIVAALVDENTVTLKRLVKVRGKQILRAENKRYRDIVPSVGLEPQGVLVGVIRNKAL